MTTKQNISNGCCWSNGPGSIFNSSEVWCSKLSESKLIINTQFVNSFFHLKLKILHNCIFVNFQKLKSFELSEYNNENVLSNRFRILSSLQCVHVKGTRLYSMAYST